MTVLSLALLAAVVQAVDTTPTAAAVESPYPIHSGTDAPRGKPAAPLPLNRARAAGRL